ncbi:leucine-rich repeat protein [Butyrivibrio sp. AE3006]|uniref:leucine-rich repeat protein n=1 Tax=Butyrivibrio sp. AE3006 TaxID=1280673 RepID=UPI0003F753BF|nr:leucine-rich repeat protein [Butyrivibrio sp. AE3006]
MDRAKQASRWLISIFVGLSILLVVLWVSPALNAQAASKTHSISINLKKKSSKQSMQLTKGYKIKLSGISGKKVLTGKNLKYSTSNKKIATITNNGVITGKKNGKAKITVTTKDKKKKCVITLKVVKKVAVKEVKLDYTSVDLKVGESKSVTATVLPLTATDQNIIFISQNEAVATVSGTGEIKAVGAGSTTVTACADGKSSSLVVTVAGASNDGSGNNGDGGNGDNNGEGDNGDAIVSYKLTALDGGKYRLEITGTGAMEDYEYNLDEPTPWSNKRGVITELVISDGITHIGDYAFYRHSALTSVTIPNSVKSIGNRAFMFCSGISTLNLGSVNTIGNESFQKNSSLQSLILPSTVRELGEYAFAECTMLNTLTLNAGLTTIGNSAFYKDNKLAGAIIIPSSVTTIGSNAFLMDENSTSDISGISFAAGSALQSIGAQAFRYNRKLVGEIVFPDSLTTIGNYAFSGCSPKSVTDFSTGITAVRFSGSSHLTTIGNGAFDFTNTIATIVLPESVISIGNYAFDQSPCDSYCKLRQINYRGTADQYWNLCSTNAIGSDNGFIRIAALGDATIQGPLIQGNPYNINITYGYTG